MIIVTSGQPFTDIDAFACAVAYSELLKLEGKNAKAVLPGPLNKTVTKKIKDWPIDFDLSLKPNRNDEFILVDISEPKFFANFVNNDKVIEIFDHRYGFENYWKDKLGKNSHIEMVGACATLIWEEFEKRSQNKNISQVSANLLYTAIISNTLNFKASVTTSRDTRAFDELKKHTSLPGNWAETYFKDQNKETESNIESAIENDTKKTKPIIAQLELWDSKKILKNNLNKIIKTMKTYDPEDWFVTCPSISESKNYLIAISSNKKQILEKAIDAKFEGNVGLTDKLWLRKEIIKKIIDLGEKL